MHPSYRGVAFLLSFGSLPIACNDKEPTDTQGSGGTGTNPPATDPSAGTTTSPSAGTTGPDQPTSTATASEPATSSSSEPGTSVATTFLTHNDTTEGDTDDTGPPVFPPPEHPACQAQVDQYVACFPRYARYAGYVGYYCDKYISLGLRMDGQPCADALEAYFACLSELTCQELTEGDPETACAPQIMAAEAACPTLFDGNASDTSGSDTGGSDTGSTG